MASTATATHSAATPSPEERALGALGEARARTLALVAHLDEEALTSVHSPIMSPLVWDLAHIAAYEDLWLAHRHAGLALLRADLADVYDAFETPRAVRGEVETLGPEDARAYMDEVRARVARALTETGIGDGNTCEMVVRHELQHSETMLQTMALAGLLPPGATGSPSPDATGSPSDATRATGEPQRVPGPPAAPEPQPGAGEWIEVPAGSFEIGASREGFAYDNERPRHTVALGGFQIARAPVTAAGWMRFAEDGGYERREWWSDEGWAWKEEHDVAHHPAIAVADPGTPACHVSWFEADAFARAHDARLPSEAEWERAAANGLPAGVGQVWEWTASTFGGYPGFVAHPYREYSEVFFGERYRVLRGGSWATSPRVKTVTFRNWDLPLRRQIFAGVRLARDGR